MGRVYDVSDRGRSMVVAKVGFLGANQETTITIATPLPIEHSSHPRTSGKACQNSASTSFFLTRFSARSWMARVFDRKGGCCGCCCFLRMKIQGREVQNI
ncbi:unnamed protein product [Pylaiella littoralis]